MMDGVGMICVICFNIAWSLGFTYWSLDLFGHLVSLCWIFLGDVGSGLNLLKHYARCQKIKHHLAMMMVFKQQA